MLKKQRSYKTWVRTMRLDLGTGEREKQKEKQQSIKNCFLLIPNASQKREVFLFLFATLKWVSRNIITGLTDSRSQIQTPTHKRQEKCKIEKENLHKSGRK